MCKVKSIASSISNKNLYTFIILYQIHYQRLRLLIMYVFTVIVFQICVQSRYKLNKKYRKLQSILSKSRADNVEAKTALLQAKVSIARLM